MRSMDTAQLALLVLGTVTLPVPGFAQNKETAKIRQALMKAREAEEAGNLFKSVMHLRHACRMAPDDKRLAKILASTHTRAGTQLYERGDLVGAYSQFHAANRLAPKNEKVLQSLGVICHRRNRKLQATRYMEQVLKINPKNVPALQVLGTYAQERDDVQTASKYVGMASKLAPDRTDLKSLATKLGKEAEVEKTFITRVKGNFRVQYQGGRAGGIERNINLVFGLLKKAHQELCQQLAVRPVETITVVVYTEEQYQEVRSMHAWARAYYDGKIRIQLRPNTSLQQSMRAELRHELTHAFLFEMFPKSPIWVHEGYAQLIEGKSAAIATGKFASGARKMLPKDLFLDGFTNSKHVAIVQRGYDQSLMAVAYLQRAGTRRQFRTFLAMVGGGVGSDEALLQVYRFDVDQMLKKAARKSWR